MPLIQNNIYRNNFALSNTTTLCQKHTMCPHAVVRNYALEVLCLTTTKHQHPMIYIMVTAINLFLLVVWTLFDILYCKLVFLGNYTSFFICCIKVILIINLKYYLIAPYTNCVVIFQTATDPKQGKSSNRWFSLTKIKKYNPHIKSKVTKLL